MHWTHKKNIYIIPANINIIYNSKYLNPIISTKKNIDYFIINKFDNNNYDAFIYYLYNFIFIDLYLFNKILL